MAFDSSTLAPIEEVMIPPKSAGIGHSGMINMVNERFVVVWNITPAMSVSVVDTETQTFVGEISTPGCAGVYPAGSGFLMLCGDGKLQYIELDAAGAESGRERSESFFDVNEDPLYDYAVPGDDGWMFMSFDGQVVQADWTADGFRIDPAWSIFPTDVDVDKEELAEKWRIGGYQPFAYNAANGLLVTLMHKGGGQETFEDGGTEVWAFSASTRRRGYRLLLNPEDESMLASTVQLTADAQPLLLVGPDEGSDLRIYDGLSGRHLRDVTEMQRGLIQNLMLAAP